MSSHNRLSIKVGDVFGDWSVVSDQPVPSGNGRSTRLNYLCRCVCGTEKTVNGSNLRRGKSTGCGCVADAKTSTRSRTHGMSREPIYAVWRTMLQRCSSPKFRQYKDYGGRGITVCLRWWKFENFLEDMGVPPFQGASLERKDNDKGYEPENVVWANRGSQAKNKRNNVRFEYQGCNLLLGEWAEKLGVKKATLASRIYIYRWPLDKVFCQRSSNCVVSD